MQKLMMHIIQFEYGHSYDIFGTGAFVCYSDVSFITIILGGFIVVQPQ